MDLTQAFFYEKVFRNQLFQKAEKEKGKFRSLLLTSLNNFLNSENRRIMALKRGQNKVICNPDFLENALLTGLRDHHSETDSFHFAWVASLLETVSQKVKEHYESNGNAVYWAVFDARLRQPCLMDSPAPSLKEICTQYSIEDEIKASTMISTVKRNFQKTLRNQVREYRCTDAGVDEELSELLDFLHKFVQD